MFVILNGQYLNRVFEIYNPGTRPDCPSWLWAGRLQAIPRHWIWWPGPHWALHWVSRGQARLQLSALLSSDCTDNTGLWLASAWQYSPLIGWQPPNILPSASPRSSVQDKAQFEPGRGQLRRDMNNNNLNRDATNYVDTFKGLIATWCWILLV